MPTILHLSHTNILSDSRILKEIESLKALQNINIIAIGRVANEKWVNTDGLSNVQFIGINLWSTKFPRLLKNVLISLEFLIRISITGLATSPTIVHCHDTIALPAAVLISIIKKSHLIYDSHELASKRRDLTPFFGAAILRCEKFLWKWVDTFISVSPAIIDWYHKNIGDKESLLILNSPQVGNKNSTLCNDKYFHKKFNIPNQAKVFIYVGILDTGRGIETCLEAFCSEENKNHVVFLGAGRLGDKIKQYTKRSGKIHLHAPVLHSDVVNIVKSADYGLCFVENISLSDYYCLPNKLFEYAFAGLPVLASNFPEIKRVVDQYNLGLTCEPNQQAIVDAVNLASNNNFLTKPVDISELSWATQAERLTARYKKILSQTATALPNK